MDRVACTHFSHPRAADVFIPTVPYPCFQPRTLETGPDEWGVLEFRRAAEAAIAQLSAKLNDSTLTDAQLETWLAEQAVNRRSTLKPNGFPDHAKGALCTLAENVRQQIRRDGRTKVAALLAEVTKKNAEAAKPLTAVKQ